MSRRQFVVRVTLVLSLTALLLAALAVAMVMMARYFGGALHGHFVVLFAVAACVVVVVGVGAAVWVAMGYGRWQQQHT